MEIENKIENLKEALTNVFPNGRVMVGQNSVRIYTESINTLQIYSLNSLVKDNEMELKIYRSGTGMTIYFTED